MIKIIGFGDCSIVIGEGEVVDKMIVRYFGLNN